MRTDALRHGLKVAVKDLREVTEPIQAVNFRVHQRHTDRRKIAEGLQVPDPALLLPATTCQRVIEFRRHAVHHAARDRQPVVLKGSLARTVSLRPCVLEWSQGEPSRGRVRWDLNATRDVERSSSSFIASLSFRRRSSSGCPRSASSERRSDHASMSSGRARTRRVDPSDPCRTRPRPNEGPRCAYSSSKALRQDRSRGGQTPRPRCQHRPQLRRGRRRPCPPSQRMDRRFEALHASLNFGMAWATRASGSISKPKSPEPSTGVGSVQSQDPTSPMWSGPDRWTPTTPGAPRRQGGWRSLPSRWSFRPHLFHQATAVGPWFG